jgi:radical SAM superfamily enzyme YgiQ (UPF0313 family)
MLTKHGITFRIGNVIGLPGETLDQMFETVDINIKAKPYLGLANIFVPFPGLELTEYARKHGYYKETASKQLPKDYFTRSCLDISKKQKRTICKLMSLFPLFVSIPLLFRNRLCRKALFCVPRFVLRAIYELFYTYKLSRMYVVKTGFWQKCRMSVRYIRNL